MGENEKKSLYFHIPCYTNEDGTTILCVTKETQHKATGVFRCPESFYYRILGMVATESVKEPQSNNKFRFVFGLLSGELEL